jgi:hypothetical protein
LDRQPLDRTKIEILRLIEKPVSFAFVREGRKASYGEPYTAAISTVVAFLGGPAVVRALEE